MMHNDPLCWLPALVRFGNGRIDEVQALPGAGQGHIAEMHFLGVLPGMLAGPHERQFLGLVDKDVFLLSPFRLVDR